MQYLLSEAEYREVQRCKQNELNLERIITIMATIEAHGLKSSRIDFYIDFTKDLNNSQIPSLEGVFEKWEDKLFPH